MQLIDVATWVVIGVTAVTLVAVIYVQAGGPVLWGPFKGVPFCGHPFEQTWVLPPSENREWRCPKCGTLFHPVAGRWMPKR